MLLLRMVTYFLDDSYWACTIKTGHYGELPPSEYHAPGESGILWGNLVSNSEVRVFKHGIIGRFEPFIMHRVSYNDYSVHIKMLRLHVQIAFNGLMPDRDEAAFLPPLTSRSASSTVEAWDRRLHAELMRRGLLSDAIKTMQFRLSAATGTISTSPGVFSYAVVCFWLHDLI